MRMTIYSYIHRDLCRAPLYRDGAPLKHNAYNKIYSNDLDCNYEHLFTESLYDRQFSVMTSMYYIYQES